MIKIFKSLQELNFGKLMNVYREGNEENARAFYPEYDVNAAILNAEQDFYAYLQSDFFRVKDAFYAVLLEQDRYISALRMEPYEDGWLLEALETHPTYRRRGYAVRLINEVIEHVSQRGPVKIYSHVSKTNHASLRTHEVCGFTKISDDARYIDGSLRTDSCTVLWSSTQGKRC